MNIVMILTNVFMIAFELYLYFDLVSGILTIKPVKKVNKIIICVVWVALIYWMHRFDNFLLSLLVIPCIYFVFSYLIFSEDIVKRILYTLIFFSITSGVEICFYITLNKIFTNRDMELIYSRNNMLPYTLILELVTLILIKLLKYIMADSINKIDRKILICFLPLPISTFLIYGGISYLKLYSAILKETKVVLTLGCVGILFSNLLLFYIFGRLKESMDRAKNLELAQLKDNLNKKYYEMLDEKNKLHSQIIHNMNYYFETIGRLAKNHEADKIIKILEGIDINIQDSNIHSYCSNVTLNAIITEKSLQAKVLGIQFDIFVEPLLDIEFVKDVDLISIFGNLLSNAIEATQKCERKYIDMQLYMTDKNKFIIFKLKNTFAIKPKRKGSVFETIKSNREKHGIGLENARKILESYGGYLNIDIQDNIFDLSTLISSSNY